MTRMEEFREQMAARMAALRAGGAGSAPPPAHDHPMRRAGLLPHKPGAGDRRCFAKNTILIYCKSSGKGV